MPKLYLEIIFWNEHLRNDKMDCYTSSCARLYEEREKRKPSKNLELRKLWTFTYLYTTQTCHFLLVHG